MNINDVAKAAKTSIATVSRVLNDVNYHVSDELRERVLKAAKDLNYSPNIVGRNLKKGTSNDIGVIVPTILNPFYPLLVAGVEEAAYEMGYNLLLCNTFRNLEIEKKYLQMLYNKQVRGIIISTVAENNDLLKQLTDSGLHIMAFDQSIHIPCDKIGFDYHKAGMMAVAHLSAMGHKHIGLISAPITRTSRIGILNGVKSGFAAHGLEFTDENLFVAKTEEEDARNTTYEQRIGKTLAEMVLSKRERPTALIAINDMIAISAIQHFQDQGLSIPNDISIIGFDNINLGELIRPRLTTVEQPAYEMGKIAANMLIEKINRKSTEPINVTLSPKLIERKSVQKLV